MNQVIKEVEIDDPALRRELDAFATDVWSGDGPDFMGCNICPIELASIEEQQFNNLNAIAEIDVPVNEDGEEDCSKCYDRKVEQFKDHIGQRACDEYGLEMMSAIEVALDSVLDNFRG